MNQKINTAIIGFGMSGEYFHAPFIDANPNFNLVKVVERVSEKSKVIYPYVQVVKNYEDVLNDKDIDLVIITTPNSTHYKIGMEALQADKHVIIEKPFTRTSAAAKELIDLAASKNKILSPFQNRRWDGDFLTVKKIISSNLLGELIEYRSHFDRFRNEIKQGTWKEEDLLDSGLLYDLGPHLIDQALVLFGKPLSVYADLRTQRERSKIIDNFELVINYSKLKVILNSGFLYKQPLVRFALFGTEGSYIKDGIDPQEATLKNYKFRNNPDWGIEPECDWGSYNTKINGLDIKGKIETVAGCYQNYFENIYEAIADQKELAVKPEEALLTAQIIELAIESNKRRSVVDFSLA
ncbi:MAG TPA: Gfo/Idh/MocA family oxidoreductase [Ignavibacteriaceae bacterium]|nr:Gfo/Idh/MocA family oxidoreductase [Ignavibacteriaceae bacterium]